jgi:SAM-dependent methyltransferase
LLLTAAGVVLVAVALRNALRGQRWYGLVYRAFYLARLPIWERQKPPSELVELIEGAEPLAPARALDLGCGTGTDSIYLARHGWDVTGVDMVPEALAQARRNAERAGVSVTVQNAEVTRLGEVVHGTFELLLDFGCFRTLPADQRTAYVKSVSAVSAPGATLLLYGFARPPRLAPIAASISADEVRERFSGDWELASAERTTAAAIQVARTRADRAFELWRFRLQKAA